MYPTLFTIGDIHVSSFSVMVLVAYMVAYFVGEAEMKRKGMDGNLADLVLIAAVLGGLGGAKILFLFQQATLGDFSGRAYALHGFGVYFLRRTHRGARPYLVRNSNEEGQFPLGNRRVNPSTDPRIRRRKDRLSPCRR